MDPPVYSERFDTTASQGALAFNNFEAFYELWTNDRQSNDQRFREIFEKVALSYNTVDDYFSVAIYTCLLYKLWLAFCLVILMNNNRTREEFSDSSSGRTYSHENLSNG